MAASFIPCSGSRTARLTRVTWDRALDSVADGFRRIIEQHGPDAVAFYLSGQLLTEDYYVANKLMKGFIGSANVDTNSRLCMASSVAAHRRAFGEDIVPGSLRGPRRGRSDRAGRIEHRLVPPGAVSTRGQEPERARREACRHRSAPHRHGRGRRPVPAGRARAWTRSCSAGFWSISPIPARLTAAYIAAHTAEFEAGARAGARNCAGPHSSRRHDRPQNRRHQDLLRSLRQHRQGRHLLLARREPVRARY